MALCELPRRLVVAPGLERLDRCRPRNIVALRKFDAKRTQFLAHLSRLHAFGNRLDTHGVANLMNRFDHALIDVVFDDIANELAIDLFTKALEFDPDFALAYAGLADAYSQNYGRYGLSEEWLEKSIEAGEKAISLKPDLSEGYKALDWSTCLDGI